MFAITQFAGFLALLVGVALVLPTGYALIADGTLVTVAATLAEVVKDKNGSSDSVSS